MSRPRSAARMVVAAIAGFSILGFTPITEDCDAQDRRRRSRAQEARPVELTPAQINEIQRIANERQLNFDDLLAASKTFMPSGRHDEFILFASGGHSGQILVKGVPSMRQLRTIAVFTPEPWQGYGYGGDFCDIRESLKIGDREVLWGDTHHPALSETEGEYDGQFLFIGDKANARLAVIDLRDFKTKQIVTNPLTLSEHGCAFVTPNTEYIIQGGQYATPLGFEYAPIEEYKEKYRGMVAFWKFDRDRGRIDREQSFALELPPYWQDLSDAGKGASDGFIFINSFNVEMATGGVEDGNPPFEAGASQRDTDYLHIINWHKAEEVFKAGKYERINGFPVIMIDTLISEGILHLTPEPKSPHGVDVTPCGEYIVVSGKLDPHVTIFSATKIKDAIANQTFSGSDYFGIPILDFDSVMETQIELGLGPLHTQFDDKGYAYTSLFLDSAVARWALGGEYAELHNHRPWSLVHKTPVQYNIGHLVTAEGSSKTPQGRYLVAMNKWSVDRFAPVGPLLPQNFQLLDISKGGTDMPVIYDAPIGNAEPHYAVMIRAEKLQPWSVYPQIGWDPKIQAVNPKAPVRGQEGVTRNGNEVLVNMTVIRSHFHPEHVHVNEGDIVTWRLTSLERAVDAIHGFAIGGYNINVSLEPGQYAEVKFVADTPGNFPFYCTEFCSALHLEMAGYLHVKPRSLVEADDSQP